MDRSNERDLIYKLGEYGPGYLARGPLIDVGVIVLAGGVRARAPYDPTDTVKVAWLPGQPRPPARNA